jgi:hypothetical protein
MIGWLDQLMSLWERAIIPKITRPLPFDEALE